LKDGKEAKKGQELPRKKNPPRFFLRFKNKRDVEKARWRGASWGWKKKGGTIHRDQGGSKNHKKSPLRRGQRRVKEGESQHGEPHYTYERGERNLKIILHLRCQSEEPDENRVRKAKALGKGKIVKPSAASRSTKHYSFSQRKGVPGRSRDREDSQQDEDHKNNQPPHQT